MNTINKVETLQELQDKYIFLDFDGVLHTLSDVYRNEEFFAFECVKFIY